MKKIFIFCILFLILIPTISFSKYEKKEHITYFGTTDKEFTVAWGSPVDTSNVTGFELKLYHVERETYTSLGIVNKDILRYTTKLPRSGHYIVYIRSVNANAETEDKKYSSWVLSTDPTNSIVDGIKKSWWLYGHVPKPGVIIFNFNER